MLVSLGCQKPRSPTAKSVSTTQQGDDGSAGESGLDAKISTAVELVQSEKNDEAMRLVQEILIASPDRAEALVIAVELYSRAGELSAAAELAGRLRG